MMVKNHLQGIFRSSIPEDRSAYAETIITTWFWMEFAASDTQFSTSSAGARTLHQAADPEAAHQFGAGSSCADTVVLNSTIPRSESDSRRSREAGC